MTAQELIEALQKVSPDKKVYCKTQDPVLGISLIDIGEVLEAEEGVLLSEF